MEETEGFGASWKWFVLRPSIESQGSSQALINRLKFDPILRAMRVRWCSSRKKFGVRRSRLLECLLPLSEPFKPVQLASRSRVLLPL